jgi:hypothetical protein
MRTQRTRGRAVWVSLTALVALSVVPAASAAAAPRLPAATSNQPAGTSPGALQLNKVLNDGGSGFTGPFTMAYDCTLSGSPEITGLSRFLPRGLLKGLAPRLASRQVTSARCLNPLWLCPLRQPATAGALQSLRTAQLRSPMGLSYR